MKKILILLVFMQYSCENKSHNKLCDVKEKTFATIFSHKKIKELLHTELKERLPYQIYFNDKNKCIRKSEKFLFIHDTTDIKNHIFVNRFKILNDTIKIGFYYKLEGMQINSILLKKQEVIEILDYSFLEF